MEYLHYLFLGPWQSIASILLIIIGLIVVTLPYLVHPVHGFKFRTLFGLTLILAGAIGIGCVFILGHQEITPEQYHVLIQEARTSDAAKKLIASHVEKQQKIRQLDFFLLQKKLAKQRHQQLIKELKDSE
ncbi:MAG: hypothetical protein ACE365_01750 [Gammaproteobacteria bacterium]